MPQKKDEIKDPTTLRKFCKENGAIFGRKHLNL